MLDTLVAAVTPELASAVAIALRIDPRERYPTAREMARAIEEGAARHPARTSTSPGRPRAGGESTRPPRSLLTAEPRERPGQPAPAAHPAAAERSPRAGRAPGPRRTACDPAAATPARRGSARGRRLVRRRSSPCC